MSAPFFEFIQADAVNIQVKQEVETDVMDVDAPVPEAWDVSFVRSNKTKYGEVFMVDVNRLILICSLCDEVHPDMQRFGDHLRERHLDIDYKVGSLLDVKIEECTAEIRDKDKDPVDETADVKESVIWENPDKDSDSSDEFNPQDSDCGADSDSESEPDSSKSQETRGRNSSGRSLTKTDFFCDKCNRYYKNRHSYNYHVKSQHERKDDANNFFCEKCQKHYKNEQTLKYHLKIKHGEKPEKRTKKHLCNYCKEVFPDKEQLDEHKKTHDPDRPFQCLDPECGATFECKKTLATHMSESHKGLRPYKCLNCPRAFTSKSSLRQHLLVHSEPGRFSCDFCGKPFMTQSTKELHMRSHTGEKPYQCELCGRNFIRQNALTQHMKRHNDTRNHECEICGKRFYTNAMLNHHKVAHSSERPFVCNECGKTFPRKISLKKHKQLHSDVMKYSCEVCGKAFRQYAGLYAHRKSHGERKALPKTHIVVADIYTTPTHLLIPRKDET